MSALADRLRWRVSLARPSASLDGLGAPTGFEDAGEVFAELREAGGASGEEPFEGRRHARIEITLRAPTPVRVGWRLTHAGRAFRITGQAGAPAAGLAAFIAEEETP